MARQLLLRCGEVLLAEAMTSRVRGLEQVRLVSSGTEAVMSCVRIFTNLRDQRDAMAGVEAVRSTVVLRENMP